MRRKDRELSEERALRIVDSCEWASISMIDEEGMPYCIPMSIVRDNEYMYFHGSTDGKKTDSLRANPNVCVVCVGDTEQLPYEFTTTYESAIITGKAEPITDEAEKIHALRVLCLRYAAVNMENFDAAVKKNLAYTALWKIKIEHITGKKKQAKPSDERYGDN